MLFDLSTQVHEVGSKLNIKTIRTCRCEKDQQTGESSSGGSKSGKKGKRHSKNSHTEKAEKNNTTDDTHVNGDASKRLFDVSLISEGQSTGSVVTDPPAYQAFPELPVDVPHHWLCDGRLLLLQDPRHPNNLKAFHFCWRMGKVEYIAMEITLNESEGLCVHSLLLWQRLILCCHLIFGHHSHLADSLVSCLALVSTAHAKHTFKLQ